MRPEFDPSMTGPEGVWSFLRPRLNVEYLGYCITWGAVVAFSARTGSLGGNTFTASVFWAVSTLQFIYCEPVEIASWVKAEDLRNELSFFHGGLYTQAEREGRGTGGQNP